MKQEKAPCESHEPGITVSEDGYIIYSNKLLVIRAIVRIIVNNELDGIYKERVLIEKNKSVDSRIILKWYYKEIGQAVAQLVEALR
jgi:hypothetical protein